MREYLNIDGELELHSFGSDVDAMWQSFKQKIVSSKEMSKFGKQKWSQPLRRKQRIVTKEAKIMDWFHGDKKLMETRNEKTLKEYKQIRNKVKTAIRKEKIEEQEEISSACKANPKKFWNYVSTKLKDYNNTGDIKNTSEPGHKLINDDMEKAEELSKFFLQCLQ